MTNTWSPEVLESITLFACTQKNNNYAPPFMNKVYSKLKEPFLIDSDAELFMYLIQGIRFGSWKDRRLNRA